MVSYSISIGLVSGIFLAIGYMVYIDHRFQMLIRVGALAIIWSLWLCRNDKVFNKKKPFSFAGYLLVHQYSLIVVASTSCGESGPIYRGLLRWRLRPGILFPNMGDYITCASDLLLRRCYNFLFQYVIFLLFSFMDWFVAMCIIAIQWSGCNV
jgi:hypothetical protein